MSSPNSFELVTDERENSLRRVDLEIEDVVEENGTIFEHSLFFSKNAFHLRLRTTA